MSEEGPVLHNLKEPWFVFYIPAPKSSDHYDDAVEELDFVSSVEEVFGVLNMLPNLTLLPNDDSIFFTRNKVRPKFEAFPGGHRVSVFTRTKAQADECVVRVLAAVLGEAVARDVTDGEPICDIVRMTHKPARMFPEAARIDVWCRASSKDKQLEAYFKDLLKTVPGLSFKLTEIS